MKERDDQLDLQSSHYEERLVELHSVIAELSRQLENQAKIKIQEEEDEMKEEPESREDHNDSSESLDDNENDVEAEDEISIRVSELASHTSTDIIDEQVIEVN